MSSIPLDENQEKLKRKINENVNKMKKHYKLKDNTQLDDISKVISENAQLCLELHKSLKESGHPPIHSKFMLKNRKVATSESFEFYNHFHPQEDLLKFIKDPKANTKYSKPDVTMGEIFYLGVFSKRWGDDDRYIFTRNADGWYIEFFGINGQATKDGSPVLYKNFDQDFISYPHNIGDYLESIWEEAALGTTKEEIDEMFKKIADWIRVTEENAPDDILM